MLLDRLKPLPPLTGVDAIDRVKQELKIGEGVMETVRIEFEPFISEGARTVHRERRRHAQIIAATSLLPGPDQQRDAWIRRGTAN